ncbi:efflux RND transporter periplasmic adaptor subunit [candidate division KSB1 bacterium]
MRNNSTNNKRGKKRKKKILLFIVLLLIIASVAAIVVKKKSKPKNLKGSVVKVEYGGVIDRLTETGTIELVRSVDVKSKISGKVKKLPVNEGETVRINQLLAIIEPNPDQALMLYGKRSAVERTNIQYLENKNELERQRKLFERKLISKQELERAENLFYISHNTHKQALLEQQILEMELTVATSGRDSKENLNPSDFTELDDYRILSPIAGIVTAREIEIGEMILSGVSAYGGGTNLFQIGDPSEMIVNSSISEVDVGKLRVGQDVEIVVDSYPDSVYHGKVKHIAPVGKIEQGASIVTFKTEIEILDPNELLRQGMSCDIDIIFDKCENVLVLPVEAVYEVMIKDEEGEETTQVDSIVAYKWDEEKYKEIVVEIGLESSNRVEILDGLKEDDEVSVDAGKKYKEFRKKEKESKKKSNKKTDTNNK